MDEVKVNVGSVATCQKKVIGVITGTKTDAKGRTLFIGKTFAGKPWQSVKPIVLANSIEEYNAKIERLDDILNQADSQEIVNA